MPPYPDEQLPTVTWSIQQFSEHARAVLQNSDDVPDFVNFVLSGRTTAEQGGEIRVNIDIFQDCILPNDLPIELTRDFDSLIGITTNLPFQRSLALYPAAPFRDTMVKSNHLKKTIQLPVRLALPRQCKG
jgi:hypothetical protein